MCTSSVASVTTRTTIVWPWRRAHARQLPIMRDDERDTFRRGSRRAPGMNAPASAGSKNCHGRLAFPRDTVVPRGSVSPSSACVRASNAPLHDEIVVEHGAKPVEAVAGAARQVADVLILA